MKILNILLVVICVVTKAGDLSGVCITGGGSGTTLMFGETSMVD